MASEVQICNIALTEIGVNTIQNLTQTSKEARTCNVLYPVARDAVLRDHNWGFASKRLALALLTETYTGWDYAYQYPTDCLVLRKIYDSTTETVSGFSKVEYEISTNEDLDRRVILTNKEEAVGIYTAAITDANLFDKLFIDALSYYLASKLTLPLRAKRDLSELMYRKYQIQMGKAQSTDSKEVYKKPNDESSFVRARH